MERFESLCNEYRENKRMIEDLQAMNDAIKLDILAIMGNDQIHVEGAAKATNKTVVSSRFDTTEFKKVYPDLFNEYSRETSYKRFCVL